MPTDLQLLNVGCGRCYHDDWTNIDLESAGPGVRQYDLRRGLPYEDDSFDGVYHSHVLEHIEPGHAAAMIAECRRVLRPGGILRVVVPDLEGIARSYLETLAAASECVGDAPKHTFSEHETQQRLANHHWMTLETIDQLTRHRGGGEMGRLMRSPDLINLDFIRSRMGQQMTGNDNRTKPKKTLGKRVKQAIRGLRKQLALAAVTVIEGSRGRAAYREGHFRQSGEVHRWMYDRVSLTQLLSENGFAEATVCSASESSIVGFDDFQLDRDGDQVRKPDSLYMEAIKRADQNAVGNSVAGIESSKRAA